MSGDLPGHEAEAARQRASDALAVFSAELRALHIACGAPTLATVVKKVKGKDPGVPGISPAALSETFNGVRLPSIDVTVRVVRALSLIESSLQDPVARQHELEQCLEHWRTRWKEVRTLQSEANRLARRARGGTRHTAAESSRTRARKTPQPGCSRLPSRPPTNPPQWPRTKRTG